MEFLHQCPNGHRVRLEARHRGQRVRCRKCRTVFEVPREANEALTESAVLRILGDFDPEKTLRPSRQVQPFSLRDERHCPRCHASVDVALRVCPSCKVYLAPLPDSAAG